MSLNVICVLFSLLQVGNKPGLDQLENIVSLAGCSVVKRILPAVVQEAHT